MQLERVKKFFEEILNRWILAKDIVLNKDQFLQNYELGKTRQLLLQRRSVGTYYAKELWQRNVLGIY